MKNLAVTSLSLAFLLMMTSCVSFKATTVKSDTLQAHKNAPKNVILMIVDGMGPEHVKATRIYNAMKPLSFEQFPCSTQVTTCSLLGSDENGNCRLPSDQVTDSAAAATAMATGVKVKNGVLSKNPSTNDGDLETILEAFKRKGKSTGIIATKLFTDATPAAFVSHVDDRGMTEEILSDIFQGSQPNVILGADTLLHRSYAKKSLSSYQMVHSRDQLKALAHQIEAEKPCSGASCPHVYGGFSEHDLIPGAFLEKSGLPLEITPEATFERLGVPHLSEMTDAALKILSKNDQGFFLMVESSMPDVISHHNAQFDKNEKTPKAIEILIREMLEVENTVSVLKDFVAKNPDTLVIVTADHETGGLMIEMEKTACLGQESCMPEVRWTSKKYLPIKKGLAKHTGVNVPLYAIGQGSQKFCTEKINNTDIPKMAL